MGHRYLAWGTLTITLAVLYTFRFSVRSLCGTDRWTDVRTNRRTGKICNAIILSKRPHKIAYCFEWCI